MAITYEKTGQQVRRKGLDVTVEFFDDGEYICTKTFRFDDEKQLALDFLPRMTKAVMNVGNMLVKNKVKPEFYIFEEIREHFEKNSVLTKQDFLGIVNG